MLDDGADATVRFAHDASVPRRLVEIDGQHGQRAFAGDGCQLVQGRRTDQRHVAVQHQHGVIVGNDGHGLHHGMTGAQLFRLQNPIDVFVIERRLHQRPAVTIDHVDGFGSKLARGANDVLQQRLARQRLQHLGQVRMHPLALPRGEYDDG